MVGCGNPPLYLLRAPDVAVATRPETLAHFPFENSLENQEGSLRIERSSSYVGYATSGGGGVGLTISATTDDEEASAGGPHLDIPLGEARLPGTIALWVRKLDTELGESGGPEGDRVVLQIRSRPAEMDGADEAWMEPWSNSWFTIWVGFAEPTSSHTTYVARVEAPDIEINAGPIEPGQTPNSVSHLAVTHDPGGMVRLYLDGSERGADMSYQGVSGGSAEALFLAVELPFSSDSYSSGDPEEPDPEYTQRFEGTAAVDNLRIYRHALSAAEIRAIYEEELPEVGDD